MIQEYYKVIFSGEVDQDSDVEDVKRNVGTIFKIKSERIDKLFSGHPVIVKKDVEYQDAIKYKSAFERAGAICSVESMHDDVKNGQLFEKIQHNDSMTSHTLEMMSCPKCGFEQQKSEECSHCGIIVRKYVHPSKHTERKSFKTIKFMDQIPGAFTYPLHGYGKYILLGGAVFFGLLNHFLMLVSFLAAGYLSAYMMRIIASSADGNDELPDWPDFSNFWDDIIRPFLLVTGVVIFSFIPAIVYMYNESYDIVVFKALIFVGLFYIPMGLTAVSIFNTVSALNPLLIIPSMIRIPSDYSISCILLAVLYGISLFVDSNKIFPMPIVGSLVENMFMLYVLMVEMRLLGLLYKANEDTLAWFK